MEPVDYDWKGLDIVTCEALLHSRWSDKDLRAERGLFAKKWWDYRHLHPVQATYGFSDCLNTELRSIIRAHVDDTPPRIAANGRVLDWVAVKQGDVFEPPADARRQAYWRRKLGGLIRARQAADELGIPYPMFCRFGLKFFYFSGGTYMLARSFVPEPNLLYGEACLLSIQEKWAEQLAMKVHTATLDRFRDPGRDDPDANEHRAWLALQANGRPEPERAYARLVHEGFFTLDEAKALVGDPERLQALLEALQRRG